MPADRAQWRDLAREAAGFVPDVARLLRAVVRDPRVPRRAKVEAGMALGYLVVPLDVVPDFLPGVGHLDDVAVVAWALRRLIDAAGEDLVREHWSGSARGLDVLLGAVRSGLRPGRLLRVVATRADRG